MRIHPPADIDISKDTTTAQWDTKAEVAEETAAEEAEGLEGAEATEVAITTVTTNGKTTPEERKNTWTLSSDRTQDPTRR